MGPLNNINAVEGFRPTRQQAVGPLCVLFRGYRRSFPAEKGSHSTPPCVEVKKSGVLTLLPFIRLHGLDTDSLMFLVPSSLKYIVEQYIDCSIVCNYCH